MSFSWTMNLGNAMKNPWKFTMNSGYLIHGIFTTIKIPLKTSSNLQYILMAFSWLFHGLDNMIRVFMGPEVSNIKRIFMALFNGFFMVSNPWKTCGINPWKCHEKRENPVNIPWIYSQDFHGFSFHSVHAVTVPAFPGSIMYFKGWWSVTRVKWWPSK